MHEGYCSQFVCLSVYVCVTALAFSYDITVTKRTYQTGLRWTQKVFNLQILLKRFLSRAIACSSLPHGDGGHFLVIEVATYKIDDHYLRALRVKYK